MRKLLSVTGAAVMAAAMLQPSPPNGLENRIEDLEARLDQHIEVEKLYRELENGMIAEQTRTDAEFARAMCRGDMKLVELIQGYHPSSQQAVERSISGWREACEKLLETRP